MKVNLKPDVERKTEELLPVSGSPTKTANVNEAVRERNERLRRERQIANLSGYFARHRAELRTVNRELRSAGNAVASDVLLDQVHTLDRTLFRKELGAVPADRMRRIAEGLALLLRPDDA